MKKCLAAALAATAILSGCDGRDTAANPGGNSGRDSFQYQISRLRDPDLVARGRQVFEQNCAECHGQGAVGAPNWTQRNPDGSFPPPPLNGSAHAWHHPLPALRSVIHDGSPSGNMPAWRDRLDGDDIDAAIAYFQSLWPEQAYEAWYRMSVGASRR